MVPFIKMHGLGNDFVIIDQRTRQYQLNIPQIADRHLGIGCDQVIIIENTSKSDCSMVVYNQDGSTSGACGNATRCVAALIMEEKTLSQLDITVSKKRLKCWKSTNGLIKIDMGEPSFLLRESKLAKDCKDFDSLIKNSGLTIPLAISMGNPHIVFFVEDINKINLRHIGPIIEQHHIFPDKINLNIAQIVDNNILLRVWERGSGETLACGSGACATVVAASKQQLIKSNSSTVIMPGGELNIEWQQHVFMTGAVKKVFTGTLL